MVFMLKSRPITSKKTSTKQCRVISLQEKIKVELGHNLELGLDVKTRRNSLANMISMFLKLFKFINEAISVSAYIWMLNNVSDIFSSQNEKNKKRTELLR
jgi:hypothetical protein